jgi:hypothetical protein
MRGFAMLTFALVVTCASLRAAEPPYVPLNHTNSPKDRYAFAWRLPAKLKIKWDSLIQGDDRVLPKGYEDHVQNVLVDLETKKVLAMVPKAQAYEAPDGSTGNHRQLDVAWSADADLAVAIYSGKWSYQSATAFRVTPKGAITIDAGKPLESAYRQELLAKDGKRYEQRKDALAISFTELKTGTDAGTFTVIANAEIPKSDADADAFESRLLRFAIVPDSAGKMAVKIAAVEKVP